MAVSILTISMLGMRSGHRVSERRLLRAITTKATSIFEEVTSPPKAIAGPSLEATF